MLVIDQYTRRIVGFGVHRGPVDGPGVCRMFNAAKARQLHPQRISTDHDPLFQSHRWQANLRVLEISEVKTVPLVPMSHPFVERTIGTVRREFLDHTLFWNARDLERKLETFRDYFNLHRVHAGIGGQCPADVGRNELPVPAKLTDFRWATHSGGLVMLPEAA